MILVAATLFLLQDKLQVPIDADLKKAETAIKATFEKDVSAKDRGARKLAGRKLLLQVAGAKDPGERFVLLRTALEMASSTLDTGTAMKSAEAIVTQYDVGPLSAFVTAVSIAKKNVAVAEDAAIAADFCLSAWEKAVSIGELDTASKFASDAAELAKKSSDQALKTAVDEIIRDMTEMKKLGDRASAAEKILATKPTDAAASLDEGLYLCAVKGDWAKGMPFLAASDDPVREIAKKDAAGPSDPDARMEIAEAWAGFAAKEKSILARRGWEVRSRFWQDAAYRSSEGIARVRISKKIMKGVSIVKVTCGIGKTSDVTTPVSDALEKDPWTPIRGDGYFVPGGGALTVNYVSGGQRLTLTAKDGDPVVIPEVPTKGIAIPGASRSFRVVAAHYGIANTWFDFTENARRAMSDPFQLFHPGLAGTDPYPFHSKAAVLQYEWHGRRFFVSVKESESIIPAIGERGH